LIPAKVDRNMIKIIKSFLIVYLVTFTCCISPATVIDSPDGSISLSLSIEDIGQSKACPVYTVTYKGKILLSESRLGFNMNSGMTLKDNFEIKSTDVTSNDITWKPVYGERSTVRDHYTQLLVRLSHNKAPFLTLDLEFRCYDSGVSMRYVIPKSASFDSISIKSEITEFQFLDDHTAWCVTSAQGEYHKKTISTMGSGVERPLTIRIDDSTYVAIAEAGLVDYARMKLAHERKIPNCITSELSSEVRSSLPLTTPWRVIIIAEKPGSLLENNDLILNLNDPCKIPDISWIKPGKVIREVSLTTQGGKACVDFAFNHNLQYVEFDAGWYGNEYAEESDARIVTVDPKRSPGPLDLQDVIDYANERHIGIILYVNRRALERQIDEILPLYRQWGIRGLKYGFVQVGSQRWTSWLHEAVRKAAKHQLMVDVHDEYRPTGYSRTYPNFMTQEGIAGDETRPSNTQTLTILFTRMLAGAADNTICYYDSRVEENASHAYQLAKAVCFYSPWQFIYWYDRPRESPQKSGGAGGQKNIIGDEPELEFFDHVPTVWDDTKVIHGSIGKYAVMARRANDTWFIGAMNSGEARTFEIPLNFLQPGKGYIAHIYSDDLTVNTRTRVGIKRIPVDTNTVLNVSLTARGGQAVRIVPEAN
jgi:alpha-glucosidase